MKPLTLSTWLDELRPIPPEVKLFRSVILNAVLDAIYGSSLTHENDTFIRADALNWFAEAGEDFVQTCEHAGFHAPTVRRKAIDYILAQREAPSSRTRPPINSHGELRNAA